MTEPPRTLLITVDLPPARGGIQTMVRQICALSPHIAQVLAPGPPVEHGLGVPVRFARGAGRRSAIAMLVPAGRRAIARARPDVVLAMHPLAALGALGGRVPTVVVVHGGELRSRLIARAARSVLPRAAHVVANSRSTLRAAVDAGADPARATVLHVGAPEPIVASPEDLSRTRSSFGGGRIVLCVARLAAHKGHEVLVDALARLPGDVRLVLVGEGPERAAIEERAARAGVAERVVLAGRVDDDGLAAAYATADVFALASRETATGVEGGGIVLLEAAAYGMPIVAADSGGIGETIEHDRTGLLVPPGDPGATAAAIERVLSDGALRARLGAAAVTMATTERTWTRFVAQLDAILAEAARG